ncbi:MAG TPA: hypothetical protein VEB21_00295, partial [Terriglobales bacterium]|nr:hypothetical protein [Terriglobales bacterium]
QTAPPHETLALSLKPLKLVVPADASEKSKKVKPAVFNADILPAADADTVAMAASLASCTGVTAVSLDMDKEAAGNQASATVAGGKALKGQLLISASSSIATPSRKSPYRCVAELTATGPSDPDADPTNNQTRLVIDVYDKNDF